MASDAFTFSTDVDLRGLAEVLPDELDPHQFDPGLWDLLVKALRGMEYESKPKFLAEVDRVNAKAADRPVDTRSKTPEATKDSEVPEGFCLVSKEEFERLNRKVKPRVDPQTRRWKKQQFDQNRERLSSADTGLDDPDEYVTTGDVEGHREFVKRSQKLPDNATYKFKKVPVRPNDVQVTRTSTVENFKRERGVEGHRYNRLEDVPKPETYECLKDTKGDRPLPDSVLEELRTRTPSVSDRLEGINFGPAMSMFEQFKPETEKVEETDTEELIMEETIERDRFLRYVETGKGLPALSFHNGQEELDHTLEDIHIGDTLVHLEWKISLKT